MTGLQSLAARTALGALFAVSGIVLTSWKRPFSLSNERFTRVLTGTFAALRLGLFVLIFLTLRIAPRGDVIGYYVHQGDFALSHLLVYRDFESSYAPLFPYMEGLALWVWHSPLALIFLATVIEILTAPLWLRLARHVVPERTVRAAALLFLMSPISVQFVTVDGQNNVMVAALIACSLWLLLQGREFLSGLTLALSIALVKFLPLLYAPAYLFCSPRRWRLVAGGSIVLVAVYGTFLLLGAPILQPLTLEGNLKGAANLGYVLEAVFGKALPSVVPDGALLLAVIALLVLIGMRARSLSPLAQARLLTIAVPALTLTLLLLSKKSWPPYLVMTLFPLCLIVANSEGKINRWRMVIFSLFGIVAVTEHRVWEALLTEVSSTGLHCGMMVGEIKSILFFLLEVSLVAGYIWLILECIRRMTSVRYDPKTDLNG